MFGNTKRWNAMRKVVVPIFVNDFLQLFAFGLFSLSLPLSLSLFSYLSLSPAPNCFCLR